MNYIYHPRVFSSLIKCYLKLIGARQKIHKPTSIPFVYERKNCCQYFKHYSFLNKEVPVSYHSAGDKKLASYLRCIIIPFQERIRELDLKTGLDIVKGISGLKRKTAKSPKTKTMKKKKLHDYSLWNKALYLKLESKRNLGERNVGFMIIHPPRSRF